MFLENIEYETINCDTFDVHTNVTFNESTSEQICKTVDQSDPRSSTSLKRPSKLRCYLN